MSAQVEWHGVIRGLESRSTRTWSRSTQRRAVWPGYRDGRVDSPVTYGVGRPKLASLQGNLKGDHPVTSKLVDIAYWNSCSNCRWGYHRPAWHLRTVIIVAIAATFPRCAGMSYRTQPDARTRRARWSRELLSAVGGSPSRLGPLVSAGDPRLSAGDPREERAPGTGGLSPGRDRSVLGS